MKLPACTPSRRITSVARSQPEEARDNYSESQYVPGFAHAVKGFEDFAMMKMDVND